MNIGNDIGNSEIDMYINGQLIRQPNVYSLIGQMPWKDDDVEVQKNLKNILCFHLAKTERCGLEAKKARLSI